MTGTFCLSSFYQRIFILSSSVSSRSPHVRALSKQWVIEYNTSWHTDRTAADGRRAVCQTDVRTSWDPRPSEDTRATISTAVSSCCDVLAGGQRTAHSTAHWAVLYGPELHERLRPTRISVACQSTRQRVLRSIDIAILEQSLIEPLECLAAMGSERSVITAATGRIPQAQALNSKGCVAPEPVNGRSTHRAWPRMVALGTWSRCPSRRKRTLR